MKKILLGLISFLLISGFVLAENRIIYKSSKAVTIFTNINCETAIIFEEEIVDVSMDYQEFFKIKIDGNKFMLRPVIDGFLATRPPFIMVTLKNRDQYRFLIKYNDSKYDEVVEIRNTPDNDSEKGAL